MADEAKLGKPWHGDELDAIVADYFDMLEADLAGQPYVKSEHSRALMARIGRIIGPSSSNTKTFQPHWMNWECPGYRATSPSGITRTP